MPPRYERWRTEHDKYLYRLQTNNAREKEPLENNNTNESGNKPWVHGFPRFPTQKGNRGLSRGKPLTPVSPPRV